MTDNIANLSQEIYYFALSATILAALTGILMHVIYSFGIRYLLNKKLMRIWLKKKIHEIEVSDEMLFNKEEKYMPHWQEVEKEIIKLAGSGNEKALYTLTFPQLCGQISGAIRAELEYSGRKLVLNVFAASASHEDMNALKENKKDDSDSVAEARERIMYYAERGVDELQVFLKQNWYRKDYIFSFCISYFTVLLLLVTSNRLELGFQQNILYLAVAAVVGLLAPIVQQLFEKKIL